MKNILEYLEDTEMKLADHIAVDDGCFCLTWHELLDLSRRLGTAFCGRTESRRAILILMEKSAPVLAAMFGVVYAGCFYVMADPSQPTARIREILKVLEPELVVTDKEHLTLLEQAGYGGSKCLLDDVIHETIDMKKLTEIRADSKESDLLYGLFTSGSTGTPKGIVVSQQAVIKFITHFINIFGITENDRIGNQAPFDFDVSVKDIYSSIMTGAKLIIIPKKLFSSPPMLLDYLCEKKVTTLIWAVSALCLISSLKGLRYKVPTDVKRILFSGEVMPVKQLRLWQEALPNAEFVNLYGPTEITCNCTYYPVDKLFEDGEKMPIGKSFPGRDVFLLDENGKEINVPDAVEEICVAGESLSDGYYHNPEETTKKFISHPRYPGESVKCYRTGDLGYYDKDGNLYFSGRKDFQIKHMGHRIELEEIERAFEKIPGVERTCCIFDTKRNRIVAFYMGGVLANDIRKKLKDFLPAYMHPSKFVQTEMMPLNKNGKTDRTYFRKKLEV